MLSEGGLPRVFSSAGYAESPRTWFRFLGCRYRSRNILCFPLGNARVHHAAGLRHIIILNVPLRGPVSRNQRVNANQNKGSFDSGVPRAELRAGPSCAQDTGSLVFIDRRHYRTC
jgi:hypothetical protein